MTTTWMHAVTCTALFAAAVPSSSSGQVPGSSASPTTTATGQEDPELVRRRESVAKHPEDLIERHNLAVFLFRAKRYDEARRECRTVIDKCPGTTRSTSCGSSTPRRKPKPLGPRTTRPAFAPRPTYSRRC